MTPKVFKCICRHEWQDKKYGAGMRLCNEVTNRSKAGGSHRCTVCKRVHGAI